MARIAVFEAERQLIPRFNKLLQVRVDGLNSGV